MKIGHRLNLETPTISILVLVQLLHGQDFQELGKKGELLKKIASYSVNCTPKVRFFLSNFWGAVHQKLSFLYELEFLSRT